MAGNHPFKSAVSPGNAQDVVPYPGVTLTLLGNRSQDVPVFFDSFFSGKQEVLQFFSSGDPVSFEKQMCKAIHVQTVLVRMLNMLSIIHE